MVELSESVLTHLDGRIILIIRIVDVPAPFAPAQDDRRAILERLERRVPPPTGHVHFRVVQPFTVSIIARI